MREEDGPLVTNELVEVNLSLSGESLEVGGNRAQAETIDTDQYQPELERAIDSHTE